jgi:uncharacterized protein YjbI with pentapeptide repeats
LYASGGKPVISVSRESHALQLREAAESPSRDEAREAVAALTQSLIDVTGRGLDLSDSDFSGTDLSDFDLRGARLNRTRLYGASLAGCNLSGATIICAGLERTSSRAARLRGAYVHALAAQVCDFRDADLSDIVDATGSMFHGCKMDRARFHNATLAGATFYQTSLRDCAFDASDLNGAAFNECDVGGARFPGATVSFVVMTKCVLTRTTLAGAHGTGMVVQRPTGCDELELSRANLPQLRLLSVAGHGLRANELIAHGADVLSCGLTGSSFEAADLTGARFENTALDQADFDGARLTEASFSRCTAIGARFAHATAEYARFIECKLQGAFMSRFAGRGASFRDSDLRRADLSDAYLYRGIITGDPPSAMSLRDANLCNANLVQAYVCADLDGASLIGAHLVYARLNQSFFRGANLNGVNAYAASCIKVDFTDATLFAVSPPLFADRCIGLEEAVMQDPASQPMLDYLRALRHVTKSVPGSST